ncbi:MAG: hypothetical protein DLM61_21410 [Pseudonocardiales bacterium]|nr:MAG: hypothetical protein DLM61_21410 [Pseudonocardiales bacterium]
MWQSAKWNGTQATFQNLLIPLVGLVLAHLFKPLWGAVS